MRGCLVGTHKTPLHRLPGQAELLNVEDLSVIFLVTQPRAMYHDYACRQPRPLDRGEFLASLVRPFRHIIG